MTAENAVSATSTSQYFYRASADDFKKVPGSPIAYWISEATLENFKNATPLVAFSKGSTGLQTSNSSRFVRYNHEPSAHTIGSKWFPFAKGGGFRKWYGNVDHLVKWSNNGDEIKTYVSEKYPYLDGNYSLVVKNEATYFQAGLLTSRVTSGALSFRVKNKGEIYADACTAIFPSNYLFFLCLLSTKLINITKELNPTINFQASDIEKFPVLDCAFKSVDESIATICIGLSKHDWDSYELSRCFYGSPLLRSDTPGSRTLQDHFCALHDYQCDAVLRMQQLEEKNNRIFIEAYGLQDELTPEVPLEEITLTCNPHYRYGGNKNEEELEALLLADTMREFCSYAVGCMFGRYSLDKPGLVLANQGETLADYLKQVPKPTFAPDEDNVIPMLDGDWFPDDVTERFRKFLRVTFGEEYYEENLAFVERGLNIKNKRNYSIRDFFVKEFYAYHVKLYKKRPIYWLFSSPKGNFNALIYMHRYRPDTVSVVLQYLRDYRDKLETEQKRQTAITDSSEAAQTDKTKAAKEVERLRRILTELEDYEREVLYPLATQRLEIDLDDGVKFNYPRFRPALKKVTGLEAQ